MAGWFERRIVRADLRDSDIVASTGYSVYRWHEYLEDSNGGRWFWLVAAAMQLALFAGLPAFVVWGLLGRADLDRGDPARIGLVVAASAVSWWMALIWQGSVRRMWQERSAPRRPWDADDE